MLGKSLVWLKLSSSFTANCKGLYIISFYMESVTIKSYTLLFNYQVVQMKIRGWASTTVPFLELWDALCNYTLLLMSSILSDFKTLTNISLQQ